MKNMPFETKVLVVEDEYDWLEKITKYLNEDGFLVFQATDFECAKKTIQRLDEQSIDLSVIVLDLNLPDGDGMDLLRLIAPFWERNKTKVIIATSHGWTAEDIEAQKFPYYYELITKTAPGFKQAILESVRKAIQNREDI